MISKYESDKISSSVNYCLIEKSSYRLEAKKKSSQPRTLSKRRVLNCEDFSYPLASLAFAQNNNLTIVYILISGLQNLKISDQSTPINLLKI